MRPDLSRPQQLHPDFLAAVQDPETYEAAIACAKGQGWPTTTVVNSDLAVVIQTVARSRPPAIIVADVDGCEDPAGQIDKLTKLCGSRSKVLVIGSANDVAFYRAMVQAGAVDYLVKPLNSVVLRDAILPLLSSQDSEKGDKKGRAGHVYAVIGVRGGVGATTVAVNTAWLMAHEINQRTALVDLDLQFGNCDLALDLEPGRGLRDVFMNPDRVDALLINTSLSKESDNLSVFCAEESLEELVDYDAAGPVALLKELRMDYDHIVFDVPRSQVSRQRRLLLSAEHIVLVTDMTLAGIRDTQRVASSLLSMGFTGPLHVVAGRVGDGEAQISRATFERSAKVKIEAVIPHDTAAVKLASSRGKAIPMVAATSGLTRSLRFIASLLTGQSLGAASKSKAGFFATLFGTGGKG